MRFFLGINFLQIPNHITYKYGVIWFFFIIIDFKNEKELPPTSTLCQWILFIKWLFALQYPVS